MKVSLGDHLAIDLAKLIDTRLLIQANSGGGKSWAIRRLLESTHGKVQQIVLDIEGDFSSLREKFDFILAGKGGDIPADPKSAELLAHKVLELNADIIVDLYELKQHERIRFVKVFLDAMVNAPKALWHPVLVVLDEAHIFAPEKGQAESMGAVIDLCTRGRKRGYCSVLATQRLSKLHKDAAAECNNKLIGRTGLDIDVKRALDELGMVAKSGGALRDLDPGEFYAFGPAISKQVVKASIGSVITKHPKAGARGLTHTPAPTAKVKSVLSKLADLPKEAEEELRDKTAMQSRIKELERELRNKPAIQQPATVDKRAIERALYSTKVEIKKHVLKLNYTLLEAISPVVKETIKKCEDALSIPDVSSIGKYDRIESRGPILSKPKGDYHLEQKASFGQCERKILGFLLMKRGEAFSKVQIGAMTGYSHGSGGFNNAISSLTKSGLVVRSGSNLMLNPREESQAESIVGDECPHRLEDWISKLGACERAIYQQLLKSPGETFSKEDIAEITNYSAGSGGFNNAISRLNTLGLIKRNHGGQIGLNEEIASL